MWFACSIFIVFAGTAVLSAPADPSQVVSPMGQNGCGYLPCPFVSPEWCHGTIEHTTYWHNVTGQAAVLCQGCLTCVTDPVGKRELNTHEDCEAILCAPLGPNCKVSATREPTLLVDHNGHPCPACPVCLDYITYPPTVA